MEKKVLLIKNGYVTTMAGDDIENGYVLIGEDGKIISVGKEAISCRKFEFQLSRDGEAQQHLGIVLIVGDKGGGVDDVEGLDTLVIVLYLAHE